LRLGCGFCLDRSHFAGREPRIPAISQVGDFRSKFNTALGIEAQGFCILK